MATKKPRRKKKATRKKPEENKWKVFFKYLLLIVVVAVVSIYLYENRQEIGGAVEEKVEVAKDTFEKEKKKRAQKKTGVGYSKEARENLEALIHEEAKND